ncbi:MAG: putative quinol monooxygenase [Novosphingobium sp.]
MAIARVYSLTAGDGQETALEEAMAALADALGQAEGNLATRILHDLAKPGHYRFVEHWADEAARKAGGASVDKAIMKQLMAALKEPPATEDYEILR